MVMFSASIIEFVACVQNFVFENTLQMLELVATRYSPATPTCLGLVLSGINSVLKKEVQILMQCMKNPWLGVKVMIS